MMPEKTINTKVCLLGDFAVGKTSLVRRFVYSRFEDKYLSTIGVRVSRKSIVLPHENQTINLNLILWDLAGSEEFNRMRASYLRGAAGAVLACDLTRPETFDHIPEYLADLYLVSPEAKVIIAANKADLTENQRLSASVIEKYSIESDLRYYFTSARTGDQVNTVFRQLGQLILAKNKL